MVDVGVVFLASLVHALVPPSDALLAWLDFRASAQAEAVTDIFAVCDPLYQRFR